MHVYRIAQEALSNVSRHSGAHRVQVEWRLEPDASLSLHIGDDGCGFEPAADRPGHFGLTHMKERATAIGADLSIDSGPGRGCTLVLRLPPPVRAKQTIQSFVNPLYSSL
jgi:signal transduction histidine kinase